MRPLLLFLLAFLLAGCALLGLDGDDESDYEDVYRYTAYDEAGETVVTGTLRIVRVPNDVAGEPHYLHGRWTLDARTGDVGPQDGEGTLEGTYQDTIEGPMFSINLNPGQTDDNVLLNGRFLDDGARMAGTWSHVTFAGPSAGGAFEAERTRRARLHHVAG